MNRLDEAKPCPVAGCGKPIKLIQIHLNNKHRELPSEEFARSAGKPPFNFIRCPACHFATVLPNGIQSHKCDRRFINVAPVGGVALNVEVAGPAVEDIDIVAGAEPEQDNDGISEENSFDGDHDEDFGLLPLVGNGEVFSFMKQPTLEVLSNLV